MRKDIRVAFISRGTLFSSPGGDTIQISKTAKYLEQLGCAVRIFTTDESIPYDAYDVFHYFNLTRPADIVYHIRKTDKPFFVSPIYLDLHEFEQATRQGLRSMLARHLPASTLEYLKCVARYIRNGEKIRSTYYLTRGHEKAMQLVLQRCRAILPNSQSEYKRIKQAFRYQGPCEIIPCGVDIEVFDRPSGPPRPIPEKVLCVGRIEPRKNQLSLIRALSATNFELVIIGNPSPNHRAYYQQCREAANERVRFIENIDQDSLISHYRAAKVHVLPSWFETVGLSSLEAAFCGCNIVVSNKGDVEEYFGNDAWYCHPGDEESIRRAIEAAAAAEPVPVLRNRILSDYSWMKVAESTRNTYCKYLNL